MSPLGRLACLSLLVLPLPAMAQFTTVAPGVVILTGPDLSNTAPSAALFDPAITPTMERQRAALARAVHARLPGLAAEMDARPRAARWLFAQAARKLRWKARS